MKRYVLLAVAVGLLVGATGCGPKFPTDEPDIEGLITSATAGEGTVTILVEVPADELPSPASSSRLEYDRASVTVNGETLLYDKNGQPVDMSQLERTGQRARVWFTGAVAESYPVQATASAVQLLDGTY